MILNDAELTAWASAAVTPFDADLVNPASVDLRLGDQLRVPAWYWQPGLRRIAWQLHKRNPDRWPLWSAVRTFSVHVLWPGRFVLATSLEITRLPADTLALLLSKSSTGRTGLEHLHAGLGDPSFDGQWTWELVNCAPWPVELRAGERLMQVVLARLVAPPERGYDGRYQNQTGPTPRREERR